MTRESKARGAEPEITIPGADRRSADFERALEGVPEQSSEPAGTVGAVIVAAGRSTRLGQDKLFLDLAGRPVLARSLAAFEACRAVTSIVLVLNESNREAGLRLVGEARLSKVRRIVEGGERRQDSVLAGLLALGPHDLVAIHDGARPLVTPELIGRGIAAARATGAAIPGVPVKDTVKVVGTGEIVEETPERASLRAIQTPQVFRYDLLLAAYREASAAVTDDAALVEAQGHRVLVYPGTYDNLKITTVEDLALAEALLRIREG
jgi:2-C-methyl-D-erythritol 4-phosphate cytidylyltransferase